MKKLTDAGIYTLETLAHSSKKDLLAIKGLSEPKCEKMLAEGEPYCSCFTRASGANRLMPARAQQRPRRFRWASRLPQNTSKSVRI